MLTGEITGDAVMKNISVIILDVYSIMLYQKIVSVTKISAEIFQQRYFNHYFARRSRSVTNEAKRNE